MNLNDAMVSDWLRGEMVAYGLVERRAQEYVFLGHEHDFLIEVKATPIRKHYVSKPAADFGPDYDEIGRGYN